MLPKGLFVGTRYLFLLILTRSAGTAEAGRWVLLYSTVEAVRPYLGLSFHVYSVREVAHRVETLYFALGNQALFHSVIFLLAAICVCLTKFTGTALPWVLPVCLLMAVNTLNMQIEQMLIGLGFNFLANTFSYLRYSAWQVIFLLFWLAGFRLPHFGDDPLVDSWLTCEAVFFILGLSFLYSLRRARKFASTEFARFQPSVNWIRSGLPVLSRLLPSVIVVEISIYALVFLVGYFCGKDDVAMYGLLSAPFSVATLLVVSGIVNPALSRLIAVAQRSPAEFESLFQPVRRRVIWYGTAGNAAILILLPFILRIARPGVATPFQVIVLFALSGFLSVMSYIPRTEAYAHYRDDLTLKANVAALIVSVPSSVALIASFGLVGAALSAVVLNASLFGLYWFLEHRYLSRKEASYG